MIREHFVIRKKKVLIIFSVMATTSDPRYDWCGITGNKLSGVVDILVRYFSGDASLVGEILHPLFVYTIKILPYVALRISLGTIENIYMWRMRQPKGITEWIRDIGS